LNIIDIDPFDTEGLLQEIAKNASSWDTLSFEECKGIYDDPLKPLLTRRHVIMILRNEGQEDTSSPGWNASQFFGLEPVEVERWANAKPLLNNTNTLWFARAFDRTDESVTKRRVRGQETDPDEGDQPLSAILGIDENGTLDTKKLKIYPNNLAPVLKVDRCISEPYNAPCEVQIQNNLLLAVCIFCLTKSIICTSALLTFRRETPLITPGDAIESFISKPDPATKDMCWMSHRPIRYPQPKILSFLWVSWLFSSGPWLSGPRRWNYLTWRRRMGSVVPWEIWLFSYLCICLLLGHGINELRYYWAEVPL